LAWSEVYRCELEIPCGKHRCQSRGVKFRLVQPALGTSPYELIHGPHVAEDPSLIAGLPSGGTSGMMVSLPPMAALNPGRARIPEKWVHRTVFAKAR